MKTPKGNLGSVFSSHLALAVANGNATSSAMIASTALRACFCIQKVFFLHDKNASLIARVALSWPRNY
jgi:hypothetical protein